MKERENFHPENPELGKEKLKEIINPPPKKKIQKIYVIYLLTLFPEIRSDSF